MSMSVSFNNKPAFGCGACRKIHQQLETLVSKEPSDFLSLGVGMSGGVKPFTKSVITKIKEERGLTHGQAAQLYKNILAERLIKK